MMLHKGRRFWCFIGQDWTNDPLRQYHAGRAAFVFGPLPMDQQRRGWRARCALGIEISFGLPRIVRVVRGWNRNCYPSWLWTGRRTEIEFQPGWLFFSIWGRDG